MIADIFRRETLVINQMSQNRAKIVAYHRFMNNPRIQESDLISNLRNRCTTAVKGCRVLAIEDTTQIGMQHHAGLFSEGDDKLGPVGKGESIGFLLHPTMVIDINDRIALGFSDVKLWCRVPRKPGLSKAEKKKRNSKLQIEEKESYRWIESVDRSKTVLCEAEQVVVVTDREGDIYELFCRVPDEKTDLLVRCAYNRAIELEGERRSLFEYLDSLAVAASYELPVHTTRKRKARTAKMELKFAPVRLLRTQKKRAIDPRHKDLFVVEVRETLQSVPPGETPIHWRLYTTVEVQSIEEAMEIVEWYTLRWQIEQLFRTLKSKGLQLEQSQLHSGHGLRILALMGLEVALKIIQLTHVRDGKIHRPGSMIFSKIQLAVISALIPQWEGKTNKQKNPFPPQSLAWAAWLIARAGGWKGYQSEAPPGPVTFKRGLQYFNTVLEGYMILRGKDVCIE